MRSPYPKNEVFLFWTVRTTVVRTQVVLQLPCYDRRIFIDTHVRLRQPSFFVIEYSIEPITVYSQKRYEIGLCLLQIINKKS